VNSGAFQGAILRAIDPQLELHDTATGKQNRVLPDGRLG
jgi:hypothetical protein